METQTRVLTNRFEDALAYTARLHRAQDRKGGSVPYIAHLLAVAALVLECGGTEDEAIAALLHDAVEDQGGAPTLAEIRGRYGPAVAAIVEGCTDAYEHPKPDWRKRKLDYLEHLRTADASTLLVSAADKVHNARSILSDLRDHGDCVWDRFQTGKLGTLWYYRALADTFARTGPPRLASALNEAMTAIEAEFNDGRRVTEPPQSVAHAA
jgi:GTP pyrophosphokinase